MKEKKQYKFFNIVVDDELLNEIKELKELGVNWQPIVRSFMKQKVKEIREHGTVLAK